MVRIKPQFLKPVNIFQMQDTSSNVSTSTAFLQISNNLSSSFIPPIPLKGTCQNFKMTTPTLRNMESLIHFIKNTY